MARTLYWLVTSDPPTRDDFRSYFETGQVRSNANARAIELLKGVSMWETEEQALALRERMRARFDYVAEVSIPDAIRVVRQGRSRGHHNVYASADDLLRWVVRVARAP